MLKNLPKKVVVAICMITLAAIVLTPFHKARGQELGAAEYFNQRIKELQAIPDDQELLDQLVVEMDFRKFSELVLTQYWYSLDASLQAEIVEHYSKIIPKALTKKSLAKFREAVFSPPKEKILSNGTVQISVAVKVEGDSEEADLFLHKVGNKWRIFDVRFGGFLGWAAMHQVGAQRIPLDEFLRIMREKVK